MERKGAGYEALFLPLNNYFQIFSLTLSSSSASHRSNVLERWNDDGVAVGTEGPLYINRVAYSRGIEPGRVRGPKGGGDSGCHWHGI